ncbi:hypothetical protein CO663_18365 [Rhizobium anhuiense]|jgi:hypothetical protein|uniref:hypothetical protein n=1 Tax=Rhizobium anhuiense TaxID=1184720 RepID=UPI000BEA9AA8|nr:hypothetical protein [Rhizobium anhuiense]PDS57283.1 hypothetical protein CO663_18365 [Rhizobium anhuiense]
MKVRAHGGLGIENEPAAPVSVGEVFGVEIEFGDLVAAANLKLIVSGSVFPLIRLHERDEKDYVFEPQEGRPVFMISVAGAGDDMKKAFREILRRLVAVFRDYAAFEVLERGRRDANRERGSSTASD